MGCNDSSLAKITPAVQSCDQIKSKQFFPNSQLKIISAILPEPQNSQNQINQFSKSRKRFNKVKFIQDQELTQPTQRIFPSSQQITLQDKQILQIALGKNTILHKLSIIERKQLINNFQLYESVFESKELINQDNLDQSDPFLFRKNQIGTMFFVIKKGKVQVQLETSSGNFTTVTYGKGDSFGQLALIYRTPRTASVKCLVKCTFLCLSSKLFRQALKALSQRSVESNKILIQRIKLFQYLNSKQKSKLASQISLLKYEKGDIVFREGQESLAFYVVVSGKVDIEVKGKPMLQLKSGQYFGQSCFQENSKRLATVQCSQKTQLMSISRSTIQKVLVNQIQQFYYMSILKWSLKRNPIFRQVPPRSTDKLLKQSEIVHFFQGDQILKEGQKIKNLYIAVEGQINEFQVGDIINIEYLGDMQKDKKISVTNQIPLVKKKGGYVCVIDISKVLSMLIKHSINISLINAKIIEDMKRVISSKKQIQEIQFRTMKQIRDNSSLIKMQNIEMVKKIGHGQFGSIYKVRHILDSSFFALKIFHKLDVEKYKMRHFVKQEIDCMKLIGKHPFIVEFQKYFQTGEYFMILMEMIDGKDLFDTINEIGRLSSETIKFFFASFVVALETIHQNDIIYRDIKPENAVMDGKGYLKILDLGSARKLEAGSCYRSYTIIGTPHYMAPEVISGKGYSFEADIWSMGVLLYEISCGKFPFGEHLEHPMEIYNQIIKPSLNITFPRELKDVPLKGLISRLLIKDPSIRQIESFNEIKESDFYQDFDWERFQAKTLKPPFRPDMKRSLLEGLSSQEKKFGQQNLANFILKMESRTKKQLVQNSFVSWDEFNDNF